MYFKSFCTNCLYTKQQQSKRLSATVYNRWGQLVFTTNTMGKGWDGKIHGIPQPSETYTWILACIDIEGKPIKQSGRSLLIR
ncbi:MAG: gliding motility-associated C-terminal domain-containing protein [Chitinophagaceae bacterium]